MGRVPRGGAAPPVAVKQDAGLAVLDELDRVRLLQAAAHSGTPCRDRALVHLFWCLGPTVRQVVALNREDLVPETGALRLAGTDVPVPLSLVQALQTYIRVERPAGRASGALLCGRHGRRLAPADVRRALGRLGETAGLPVSAALLRRSALVRAVRADPIGTWRSIRHQRGGIVAPAARCSMESST